MLMCISMTYSFMNINVCINCTLKKKYFAQFLFRYCDKRFFSMLLERKEILKQFKNSTKDIEKFQMLKLKSNGALNMRL